MIDKKRVALMTLFGGRIPHPALRVLACLLVVSVLVMLLTGDKVVRTVSIVTGGISIVAIIVLGRMLPYDECADIKAAMSVPATSEEIAHVAAMAQVGGVVLVVITVGVVAWAVITHRVSPFALLYMLGSR